MTTDLLPPEKLGPEIQRDVQRLLGRCMVRIQQYEIALKSLLVHHEIAGPVETLEGQIEKRAEELSGKTLGALKEKLFETFVVPEGFERELLPEDKTPTDRISVAHSFRMSLYPEQWAQTKSSIDEFVVLRNELVHHFLSRFNIWEEQGCVDAMAYLEGAYLRIDARFQELRAWMMAMQKASEAMASFAKSETYHDWLVNGINPDGSFEWWQTGIVRALRTEVQALAGDNWIALEAVKAQVLARHPDQTPQKYRCTTWQQVLTESTEFDLEYRRESDASPKRAWVRLRPERPQRSGVKERKRPGRGPLTPPSDQLVESG
ncbi:OST-HTH/LOTUS domain-containing protein [Acidovorax sp.]|jgi:hypothetical protein|uniref:OST-HTH/LOTUS domain-containing protein n=1 Tax=Acidovorax sp. TaxID=1872122 RepID=UPI0031DCC6DF